MKLKVTRAEQKEITRQRLIEAAMQLFATKGILATSTADVAEAISMSHGSVFLHFPTRDDLVNAVIDEFGKILSIEFQKSVDQDSGLHQVLKAHLRALQQFEDFYSRLVIESPLLSLKVRGTLFMLQSAISHGIFMAVKQGQKSGTIRHIKRHLLFNTWISLIHYYLANKDLFAPQKSVIEEKGDELIRHYMSLVKQ